MTYERIKPEDVVAAYKEKDVIPVQSIWGRTSKVDGRKDCACGLSVYAMKKKGFNSYANLSKAFIAAETHLLDFYLAELLHLPQPYVAGFVHGFDGNRNKERTNEDYLKGVEDGKAAAEAVKQSDIPILEKGHIYL